MRHDGIHLAGALVAIMSTTFFAQRLEAQPPAADPVAEIRALEAAHNEAIVHADVAALDRMTAEDYTFITPRGFLVTKAEMLKGLGRGAFRYEYRQVYELKIRVYGDAAVVTGRSVQSGQERGQDYSDAYRFTRVYVRREGRWLSVAWQTTRDEGARREE